MKSRLKTQFRQVALIGKYQTSYSASAVAAARQALDDIAHFLMGQGCEVVIEAETAANLGLSSYLAMEIEDIGRHCDLCLVVGGDGTMLGIGRRLAQYKVPLIGINRGRLGFITDIPLEQYAATLGPMLAGEFVVDDRSLMQAEVIRDGPLSCLSKKPKSCDYSISPAKPKACVFLSVARARWCRLKTCRLSARPTRSMENW